MSYTGIQIEVCVCVCVCVCCVFINRIVRPNTMLSDVKIDDQLT
jgi:hypothetical protein